MGLGLPLVVCPLGIPYSHAGLEEVHTSSSHVLGESSAPQWTWYLGPLLNQRKKVYLYLSICTTYVSRSKGVHEDSGRKGPMTQKRVIVLLHCDQLVPYQPLAPTVPDLVAALQVCLDLSLPSATSRGLPSRLWSNTGFHSI